SVSRRRRELIVRFALGAQRRDVLVMIVRRAMTVVAVGLVVGLVCAALFAAWIERFLVASSPFDLPTFVAAVAIFAVVGLIASLLPARRAAATDPAGVLRSRG
ncbi:MAG TPA: FtsX-like permease family protein, partial [Thermoanaerobaculia bacterium]|nr:FtsX-like permease family protein [Thermoanaerobaculia bacterium]